MPHPKYRLLFLLLMLSQLVCAQLENNNWLFGRGLGMTFKFGLAAPIPAPAHASLSYITSTSSISDKRTGKLLFYTNGINVYNANHQLMSKQLMTNAYADHVLIVPNPGDSLSYYLFYTYSNTIFYASIDMRLNGGMGDVTYIGKTLSDFVDNRFAVVKQLYNGGYWIIAHVVNTKFFNAYRINKDGIQSLPVLSETTEDVIWPVANQFYSELVVATTGDQFAMMNNDGSSPNGKYVVLYNFDKKCGTVSLKKFLSTNDFIYDIAFDATTKYLYVVSTAGGGDRNVVQYEIDANNFPTDVLPTKPIVSGNEPMRHMKLGSDNRIYITKEEMIENGYSPSRYIDVIKNPEASGTAVNYIEHFFNLSPGNQCFNDPCYLTDRFPNMIQDRTITQPKNFEEPTITITDFCLGSNTHFNMLTPNLYADSMSWDFGDSSGSSQLITSHIYPRMGVFNASFNWYLCGQKYSLIQKIKIGAVPTINLPNDTTLCNGHTITLSPGVAESYEWSTGDTTSTITVATEGIYKVKLINGSCTNTGQSSIHYYPKLWTLLGDEYFICDRDKELVKLDAGPGYVHYKWTPTGDSSQWIIVGDIGNYFVVVEDFRGCDGADGTFVKRVCPVELFFPNVFTPNDDGVNDSYLPIGNSVVYFNIKIYNRWGEQIYETEDLTRGWNGKKNDSYAPTDSYF